MLRLGKIAAHLFFSSSLLLFPRSFLCFAKQKSGPDPSGPP